MSAVALACSACYEFPEPEPPHPVEPPRAVPPVVISRIVPEGCTRLGEVSATGRARDNPSRATENARNELRRRAADMGGNYVVLEMSSDGATHVEGTSTGHQTPWGWGSFETESTVTAVDEVGIWGTAFSGSDLPAPAQPAEYGPCGVHDDCPPGQYCSSSGTCRHP